jgi:hypothetical protein
MRGSHTSEHIFGDFESVMLEFGITDKVIRVISDKAPNVRKAFEVSLQLAVVLGEEQKNEEVEANAEIQQAIFVEEALETLLDEAG